MTQPSGKKTSGRVATLIVAVLMLVPMIAGADEHVTVAAPAFDLDVVADGSILATAGAGEGASIVEIRKGAQQVIAEVPMAHPALAFNGLAALGRGNFFATSGGSQYLDPATAAKLWRISQGEARIVADVGAFEVAHDPDAFEGPRWKDQLCEELTGFVGPENNLFHMVAASGSEAIIADAAGNTLISARSSGHVDWVALFTPPVDEQGEWKVLFDAPITCYVQPVPTSVDIGADGAYYVGELTGFPATPGDSRVWRIEPGANNVVCPSAHCTEVLSGLTSVMDVAFAADGDLLVLEYDSAGWFAATEGIAFEGGVLRSCDLTTDDTADDCDVVEDGLVFPGAIDVDKRGRVWLLENNIGVPGLGVDGPIVRIVTG